MKKIQKLNSEWKWHLLHFSSVVKSWLALNMLHVGPTHFSSVFVKKKKVRNEKIVKIYEIENTTTLKQFWSKWKKILCRNPGQFRAQASSPDFEPGTFRSSV